MRVLFSFGFKPEVFLHSMPACWQWAQGVSLSQRIWGFTTSAHSVQ